VITVAEGTFWSSFPWMWTGKRRMECTAADTASWIAAIRFDVTIILAVDTLAYNFGFVWFFYFYFGVDKRSQLINVVGFRSTKNNGSRCLLILCKTLVTWRTSNKHSSSSDLIRSVDVEGWRLWMTTRVGLSSLRW